MVQKMKRTYFPNIFFTVTNEKKNNIFLLDENLSAKACKSLDCGRCSKMVSQAL